MLQGRPLSELKFRAEWTWPWGPPFVVGLQKSVSVDSILISGPFQIISVAVIIVCMHLPIFSMSHVGLTIRKVQGWSSIIPKFTAVDFASFYIEIPVMIAMYVTWMLIKQPGASSKALITRSPLDSPTASTPLIPSRERRWWYNDVVDLKAVDLVSDEYREVEVSATDDDTRQKRMRGWVGWLWKIYFGLM